MEFGDSISRIRKEKGLTQQQMADQLYVTRQAVSNWENNKNLPDLYQIIEIAQLYYVSLDELILGGTDMNKTTEKLINDSKETKQNKRNHRLHNIGFVLLLLGMICIVIKAMTPSELDEQGILQEAFFLLPLGFLLIFAGFMMFVIALIINIIKRINKKETTFGSLVSMLLETAVLATMMTLFFLLIMANSSNGSWLPVIVSAVLAVGAFTAWITIQIIKK